jgi:hypothetical protein
MVIMDDEDAVKRPPWLHLLPAPQREFRENEIAKGRVDIDVEIERELRRQGRWPERRKVMKALKAKKAKNAKRPKRRKASR